MSGLLLQATSISKSYAGVHALKDVSFDLRAGEVHALVGENGAGKSTLIKIITGAVSPDAGPLTVGGRVAQRMDPQYARARWASPPSTSSPRCFPISPSPKTSRCRSSAASSGAASTGAARRRAAAQLLDRIGASIDPDRIVGTLSMPEQQLVEIAKAIGADARILIMDEPTASLTDREVERLFDVIRLLRAQDVGIIYISHRLDEIFAIADRITVLRDGETVATTASTDVDRAGAHSPDGRARAVSRLPEAAASTLGCRSARAPRPLEPRERAYATSPSPSGVVRFLGSPGSSGSGRTELAETLFGLTSCRRGRDPASAAPPARDHFARPRDRPRDRLCARRIAVSTGSILEMSVAANASLANLRSVVAPA